jgi:hypothetical protein
MFDRVAVVTGILSALGALIMLAASKRAQLADFFYANSEPLNRPSLFFRRRAVSHSICGRCFFSHQIYQSSEEREPKPFFSLRDRAAAARQAHNLEVGGSSPPPAT